MLASHRVVENYLQEFLIRARLVRATVSRVLLLTRGGPEEVCFGENLGASLDVAANDGYGRLPAGANLPPYRRDAPLDPKVLKHMYAATEVAVTTLQATGQAMRFAWEMYCDVATRLEQSLVVSRGLGSTHPRDPAITSLLNKVEAELAPEGMICGSCLPHAYLLAIIAGLRAVMAHMLSITSPSVVQLRAIGLNEFDVAWQGSLRLSEAEVRMKCRTTTRLLRSW